VLKIRLFRTGRCNHAQFRLVLVDARVKRQGQYNEHLGVYDPNRKRAEDKVDLDLERIKHWLGHGAQPTVAAMDVIKLAGFNVRAFLEQRRVNKRQRVKEREKAKAKAKAQAQAQARGAA